MQKSSVFVQKTSGKQEDSGKSESIPECFDVDYCRMVWNSLKISRVFLFSRSFLNKNWRFLHYFAKFQIILEISQLWLAEHGQEDKLVSSINTWIPKKREISNSVRRKKADLFSNFCTPMAGCYLQVTFSFFSYYLFLQRCC